MNCQRISKTGIRACWSAGTDACGTFFYASRKVNKR